MIQHDRAQTATAREIREIPPDWVQRSLRTLTRSPPPCGVETSEARSQGSGVGVNAH
jgi:hypothetical protein